MTELLPVLNTENVTSGCTTISESETSSLRFVASTVLALKFLYGLSMVSMVTARLSSLQVTWY